MTKDVNPNSQDDRFPGSIARKSLLVILPAIILPAITTIIGVTLLSYQYNSGRIIVILVFFFIIGFIVTYLFDRFLNTQIIQPVKEIIDTTNHFNEGDLSKRSKIYQNDEIGLLAQSINQIGEKFSTRINLSREKVNTRTQQIRTAAEIAQAASSSVDIDYLLQQTVDLIVDRFNHYHSAIFLVDQNLEHAFLKAVSGSTRPDPGLVEYGMGIGSPSMVGWVIQNNQLRVAPDVEEDPFYIPFPNLSFTRSEAVIPISTRDKVLGALDVQDATLNGFSLEDIYILQTIANQIAFAIQNQRAIENAPIDPETTRFLYQTSHIITKAETVEDVLTALTEAFQKLPFAVSFYVAEQNVLKGIYLTDQEGNLLNIQHVQVISTVPTTIADLIPHNYPISIRNSRELDKLPDPIVKVSLEIGYHSLTLFPLFVGGKLFALIFLGATQGEPLTKTALDAITILVEISLTSLEKVRALQIISDRLAELRTINTISQAISLETNLPKLYEVIHQQIIQAMGKINFLIALYSDYTNTIEIPYMDDGVEITSVPPFPLGQGLTSIIIRTRQPLMIVEDTVNRIRALGAIVTGEQTALSWLGVPMIMGEDILGAIIVQDFENEGQFDEDDMRLLTTLASQVAIAIRNTRLIAATQDKAERDRLILDISNKIRQAEDIKGVLSTTARELSKAFEIQHTKIELTLDAESHVDHGNEDRSDKDVAE